MNIYDLSRNFFNYSFENPTKVKPNHIALYFFAIEHCNRLGWKKNFGLPTTMVMEAIGIKSYNTYANTLNDLVSFGFIKMIEKSKNQYSSNIIALSNFNKALDKALDKALIKHSTKQGTKQSESTQQSIDSIDIQINNSTSLQDTSLQINNGDTENFSQNFEPTKKNNSILEEKNENTTSLGGGAKKVDKPSKPKIELVYPFESEEFMKWWNILMQSKKWSKKPLTAIQTALYKLQNFDEAFSIELIQTAIQGDYAGLVFGNDTQVKFNNYKKSKSNGNFGTDSKGNPISRAGEVFYQSNVMFDKDAHTDWERHNQDKKNANTGN